MATFSYQGLYPYLRLLDQMDIFVFNLRTQNHVFSTVAALTNLLVLKQLPVSLKQPDSKTVRAAGPSPTQPRVLLSLIGSRWLAPQLLTLSALLLRQ